MARCLLASATAMRASENREQFWAGGPAFLTTAVGIWSRRTRAGVLAAMFALTACDGSLLEGTTDQMAGDGDSDGDGTDDGGDGPGGAPPSATGYENAPPPAPLPDMALAAAAGEISGIANSVGFTRSIKVENASTGQLVVALDPAELRKPASNMKLFTTAAAFEALGEDTGLALEAYATGPVVDGVLQGDLVILGGHDITLSDAFYPSADEPLRRLAAQLYRGGLRSVTGGVVLSGELVYAGYSLGYLDVAAERQSAVGPTGAALAAAGIAAGGVTSSTALEPPAGATRLARHAPITLLAASSHINVPSHNEWADMLMRQLGWSLEGDSSYGGGGKAITDWLTSIGAPVDGVAFNDGSGLSHANRVSADVVCALLAHMERSPVGAAWRRTLAIGGVRGTLASRFTDGETRGRVFGKTGTLNDTITLSGYLENVHDGQRYRFSILFNAVNDSALARTRQNQIVGVIGRNLRGAGPRLPPPRMSFARGVGHDGYLAAGWTAVEGATGYVVQLSDDGQAWDRSRARLYSGTEAILDDLTPGQPTYLRVTALADNGLESDASQVLAAFADEEPADVLLVDANERWRNGPQDENVLVEHHDFLVGLAAATPGRRVDSAANRAVADGAVPLDDYGAVVWALGEESTVDDVMSEAEQAALEAYLAGGGAALLSGAELLYALEQRGGERDLRFAGEVLGASMAADDAGTAEVEGIAGTAFAELPLSSFANRDRMSALYPDVLGPVGDATPLVAYVGGAGGAAALGRGGQVIVTGFPVESILSTAARGSFLQAAYQYLGLP